MPVKACLYHVLRINILVQTSLSNTLGTNIQGIYLSNQMLSYFLLIKSNILAFN